ncbi:MAG: adenosylmethionine decarboxylase, partial [Deltaproteobacteria bacterium]|nr:adenosylmethionine decarboxylase [Deltaproteobacteria bacterium]
MLKKNIKHDPSFDNTGFALGRQLTLEFYQCNPDVLLDKDEVEKALLKAAKDSGATIVHSSFHNFEPQGVSGVVIIAESHFTIHAWPEHDYAAVDIFTCGDSIDLDTALDSLETSLGSQNVVVSSDQNRGIISKPAESVNFDEIIKTPRLYPISWESEYKERDPWGVLTSVD